MADESREIRKNRAIRRLRVVVLLATVTAVAAVVALFVVNRIDRPPAPEEELEPESLGPTGELVTVGEGFERTFSEADRSVFTVRGERYAVDREGVVYLEGVEVTVFREEGGSYEIEASQARFDLEKRTGRLAGGVRLASPGELELTAPQLQITHGGNQVRTSSAVEFRLGDSYHGRAKEGLRAWLIPRRFLLEGYVKVESLPGARTPLQLEADGLLLDRTRNLVRSRNWALLRRPGERISALGMELFFAEDETTPRFVRAQGKVQGFLRRGPGGVLGDLDAGSAEGTAGDPGPEPDVRRLSFRSETLTLLLTEDGRHPRRLDLQGGGGGRATVRTLGPREVPHYRLTAPAISADFEAGDPVKAEATDGVVLVMDAPPEGPEESSTGAGSEAVAGSARKATAKRAEARFDETGEITAVVLEQDVVLEDGAVRATGDRGVFRTGEEAGELQGRPAVAVSERGRMEAPRILYTRDAGLLHGTDGVRVRLQDAESSVLGGSPLARGDGPVWVEAQEGYLRDEPRAFLFVGDVRAWRGEDLLVTEELRGDEPEDRLTATGGVRSLWTPEEDEGGDEAPQAPLKVEAKELLYRRLERLLLYTGDVVAKQEGRTVACDELEVGLAEGGGTDELVCTGHVRLEDPEQGRTLQGERAVYDPQARTVEVVAAEGGKVTMRDREGNVIEGPRMIYDIDQDRVRVVGREGGRAPQAPAGSREPGPGAP